MTGQCCKYCKGTILRLCLYVTCRPAIHNAAGVKLEPEQVQKIEAEAAVVAEIKELGGTV